MYFTNEEPSVYELAYLEFDIIGSADLPSCSRKIFKEPIGLSRAYNPPQW
jgi:hypothetical protein